MEKQCDTFMSHYKLLRNLNELTEETLFNLYMPALATNVQPPFPDELPESLQLVFLKLKARSLEHIQP